MEVQSLFLLTIKSQEAFSSCLKPQKFLTEKVSKFFYQWLKNCYHGQEKHMKKDNGCETFNHGLQQLFKDQQINEKANYRYSCFFSPLHLTSYTQQQLKPT